MSSLKDYEKKRSFKKTPEPGPKRSRVRPGGSLSYRSTGRANCIMTFGSRLTACLSPGLFLEAHRSIPKTKRLAMQVEDHPVDYAKFEGVIPKARNMAAAGVMVWDYGTYQPEETRDVIAALKKGELKFS